eukprot:TRINITY_DN82353_c0_g1_i1.p1 TRINITY_DN82353_c0_g1~~TRINITY_DN82353_c0_g1_i1.p1  ORF type:complete len:360 (-),score=55.48 TRINITY_DN82353_c0_g1_i1:45-1088(-)
MLQAPLRVSRRFVQNVRRPVRHCSGVVEADTTEATPPPPASSLSCGGFFFAVDPNIGLWNDRVNPNWRFTFTDSQTKEKQRIPYAFSIQHRGPHAELAVRFQFGFTSCNGTFAKVPQTFEVENGWELSLPLPLSVVRLCHTVLQAPGTTVPITVYCVDCAFGIGLGFQKAVSGKGVKGVPELAWRNEVAMVAFIMATLWALYSLATLPSTWQEFFQDLEDFGADEEELAFKALDRDGDGYITREDVHLFVRQADSAGLLGGGDAKDGDILFDAMDTSRSGYVSFEQFQAFMKLAQEAQQGNSVAYTHPRAKPMPNLAPLPGLVGTGLSPPIFIPPGPTRPGPPTPSW